MPQPQGPSKPNAPGQAAVGGKEAGPKLGAALKAAKQTAAQKHHELVAKARHGEDQLLIGGGYVCIIL